jgi:hypothetical protein
MNAGVQDCRQLHSASWFYLGWWNRLTTTKQEFSVNGWHEFFLMNSIATDVTLID